jgi:general stress protein YciG
MADIDDKHLTPEPNEGKPGDGQHSPATPGVQPVPKKPRKRSKGAGGGMTVAEAGRKGGQAVRDKYGPSFYETIGKKGGEAVKAERGHAFYEEIGKKGGESVKASRGSGFYEEIGKRGGHRVRELIEDAKRGEKKADEGEKGPSAPDTTH